MWWPDRAWAAVLEVLLDGLVVEVVDVVEVVVVVGAGPDETAKLTVLPGGTWAPAPGF